MTGKGPVCIQYRQHSFGGIYMIPSLFNPLMWNPGPKDEGNIIINKTVTKNGGGDLA